MTPATRAPKSAPNAFRQDAKTIGLIGLAHGTSHFFHMLLPPLFPVFIRDFGLSYAELGLLVSVFFVISGIGQATSGFLVDRFGARPLLLAALSSFAAAALTASAATGYTGLLIAAALAGLGNAPFHPVDFTILNKRVSPAALGHAFSVHGISGNLGWALAPVFLAGIAAWTGSWRAAYLGAAALPIVVIALLYANRAAIDDRAIESLGGQKATKSPSPDQRLEHPLAFLKLPAVWLCFGFFFWTTGALSAIQSFASPALQNMYGLPLATTALVVTAYMLAGALGMVLGGFLVGRVERLERTIGAALAGSALLLTVAGWSVLPGLGAMVCVALAGFGTGLAGPSRDMLIRRAAPPGATGRVYGTVYSGLDLGFALASPVFGAVLDHGHANGVFFGSALLLVFAVVSAGLVGGFAAKPRPVAQTA